MKPTEPRIPPEWTGDPKNNPYKARTITDAPVIFEIDILNNIIAAFDQWDEDLIRRSMDAVGNRFGYYHSFGNIKLVRIDDEMENNS